MTRAALAIVGGDTNVAAHRGAIELRVEDRLQSLAAPIRTMSLAMVAVAAGSLVVHVALMTVALVVARTPLVVPPQREIAVEIVQDTPKPVPPPKPPLQAQVEKAERTPPQPAAPSKPAAQREPQALPQQPKAQPDVAQLKAMENELAGLRAEQAALKAQSSQEASGKALALPSIGGSDGDAIGYQQLVFSQLIKAKGDGEYNGQAGTTGVRFEMDEAGRLVRAEVTRSSGSAALDGQALDIVHRAAPFPPPPTAADRIVFANVNFVPPKHP